MLSPKAGEFHQHFNTGDGPARYLKIRPGALNSEHWNGGAPDQIDYADEDPQIYKAYAEECARNGRTPFRHPGKAKARS